MEITDLKTAIDDYSDAAENGIMDLKSRLDDMETKMARPGGHDDCFVGADDHEHKDAFITGFMQKGDDTALKMIETKALSTASGGDGGFAVPMVIDTEIEKQLKALSPLRSVVKVKTIETSNYKRLVVDLVHALSTRYRQGAKFIMNSKTLAAVRKMKDTDGNFIWRAGLAEGQPDMLLGYPVVEAEDMPDMAAGSRSIAFGNFERAYTLVERHGVRVLRDPYSNKPYVNFYATKRVGGALVNEEALKLIEFSV